MEAIVIDNVSKSYGKILALDKLNLSIKEGEIYGFIGPNGAGKSTTIRLMLNFLQTDKGNIFILGYSPKTDDVKIKQFTGYVSSDTFMYTDMKVSELFRFTESYYGVNSSGRTKELIEILEIDTQKKFEQLSFGNRKKVSVACALLHRPKLLILDEPSNGLDPVIRASLYELLKEEQKNGVTIFFSSHVLHEVYKFCSRIGLIREGVLIRETAASEFTDIGYRQVSIETDNNVDLSGLEGIAGVERRGSITQFMFSGNQNELIKMLGKIYLNSVHIEEPDLETVFMHYFK